MGHKEWVNAMKQSVVHIALIVDDYDKAIKFYTEKFNFTLIEDTLKSETKCSFLR